MSSNILIVRIRSVAAVVVVVLLFFCALVNLTHITKVLAAEEPNTTTSITVSPARNPLNLKPGQHYDGVVKVINTGPATFDFKMSANPYSISNENYDPNFDTKDEFTQLSDWVKFGDFNKTLDASQTREVPYTIDVPEDAEGGGQYATLMAETIPSIGSDQTGVAIGKRVGMLLFIKVDGDLKVEGDIVEQNVRFWYQAKPVDTLIRVHSSGNVDSNAHYGIKIKGLFETIFGRDNMAYEYDKDSLILPHTTRKIPVNWDNAPYAGIYHVDQDVRFASKDGHVSKWILICPLWLLLLIIAIVLLIIFFIVWKILRRVKKNKDVPNQDGLTPAVGLTNPNAPTDFSVTSLPISPAPQVANVTPAPVDALESATPLPSETLSQQVQQPALDPDYQAFLTWKASQNSASDSLYTPPPEDQNRI